jgi:hypothetical protein
VAFAGKQKNVMKNSHLNSRASGAAFKLGFSTAEAIGVIGSQKLFRRALHAGWICAHVSTGAGGVCLYSWESIEALWARLGQETPPLLPCEAKAKGGASTKGE